MKYILLITIFITILQSSISIKKDPYCKPHHENAFKICGYLRTIIFIHHETDSRRLTLTLDNYDVIAPYSLRNLTLKRLRLSQRAAPKNCIPKYIDLAPETFDGLIMLKSLVLVCIKFNTELNPFSRLESLSSLQLEKVEFEEFPTDLFASFKKLEKLTLSSLGMINICPSIFSEINPNLKKLQIEDDIRVIEPQAFQRFSYLLNLELPRNQLKDIQSDMFDGLVSLLHLDLKYNKLTVLRNATFNKMPRLQYLTLKNNKLISLEINAFSGLTHLRELNLGHNHLKNISSGVFRNLKNLKLLDLRSNKIEIITSRMFKKCSKLRILKLAHNQINQLEPEAFFGLHLQTLDLTHNNLKGLEYNSFSGLHIDGVLDLHPLIQFREGALKNLTARWIVYEDGTFVSLIDNKEKTKKKGK